MQVTPLKTPIVNVGDDLQSVVSTALERFSSQDLEDAVLVITSKVISLAEGNVVQDPAADKHHLVRQQAERYTEPTSSKYGVMLTIKDGILAVNAGIDESNIDGGYVLLPRDAYQAAEDIWQQLRSRFNLKNFGVIITDSASFPLKWGVVGRALAYCGIQPLKDLRGEPDLFGRPMKMTQINVVEGIASAAVLEMGEGNDSTPLCLVSNVKHAAFEDHPPTQQDRDQLQIAVEDDVYAPLLQSDKWQTTK